MPVEGRDNGYIRHTMAFKAKRNHMVFGTSIIEAAQRGGQPGGRIFMLLAA